MDEKTTDDFVAFRGDGQPLNGEERPVVSISFEDVRKNVLALGATGTGKTVGVALPALQAFINRGMGGLVIDIKGELRSAIQRHYGMDDDRFYYIGDDEQAESVNLLSGFRAADFGDFLRAQLNVAAQTDNRTFTERGVEMVEFLFRALEILQDRKPTIAEIIEAFDNPQGLMKTIRTHLTESQTLPERYRFLTETLDELRNGAHQFHILRLTSYFGESASNQKVNEQIGYYRSAVLPCLKTFTNNPTARRAICGTKPLDLREAVYDQNRIVVLDIPPRSDAAVMAQKLIRSHFQDVVFEQKHGTDDYPGEQTFTLADDYQQIVSFDRHLDDNHWLDICRGLDHGVVALTQSISSLQSEAPHNPSRVMTLVQNYRTKVFLPTSDPPTIDLVRTLASKGSIDDADTSSIGFDADPTPKDGPCHAVRRLLYPDGKGMGLLYKSVASQGSPAYFGPIRTGTVPGHEYMGRFIHAQPDHSNSPDEGTDPAPDGSFKHTYDHVKFRRMAVGSGGDSTSPSPEAQKRKRQRKQRDSRDGADADETDDGDADAPVDDDLFPDRFTDKNTDASGGDAVNGRKGGGDEEEGASTADENANGDGDEAATVEEVWYRDLVRAARDLFDPSTSPEDSEGAN